jgi:ketol-acid reductoisomerase
VDSTSWLGFTRQVNRGRLREEGGLTVLDTDEAVRCAEIIFLALPDTKIPEVFEKEIAPHLQRGQTLLFAHGLVVYFWTFAA